MTSWKNNASFKDWKSSLRALLDLARAAIVDADDQAVEDVYRDLENYIIASDDTIPGVAELDLIARQTMRDLVVASVARNVQAIADRTADVAELEKRFSKQSAVNNSIAADLRLQRVRAVLDAGTQAITSLRALSESLPSATDSEAARLEKQITLAIAALNKVLAVVPRS
jgi:hypothetical protein